MTRSRSLPLLLLLAALCLAGCRRRGALDLAAIPSPVLFRGDSLTAYRDPAALYHDGRFYLFFTLVETEGDSIFSYTAQSEITDLIHWSRPRKITPRSQEGNFSGPGNVVRFGDEWVMCLHSYPRPGYTRDQPMRYGNSSARLYTMRSRDLEHWSQPRLLHVKGPMAEADMGRMIHPYLFADKDQPNKWWCFYKQNGIEMAYSFDLETWTPAGHMPGGENVCMVVKHNEYVLFHSPPNGIALRKSRDLTHWADDERTIYLGQADWPWARGRVTGAAILDLTNVPDIGAYLMFFAGSGPASEHDGDFDRNSSIGITWSRNLVNWHYPKER